MTSLPMHFRWLYAAFIPLVTSTCSPADAPSSRTIVERRAGAIFERALATAQSATADDELHSAFRAVDEIVLDGPQLARLSLARLTTNRLLVVMDNVTPTVELFDLAGAHRATVGGPGIGSSLYGLPLSIVDWDDGLVGILDARRARLGLYRSTGQYDHTMLLAQHNVLPINIARDPATARLTYVMGRRSSTEPNDTGAFVEHLVHGVDNNNRLMWSAVEFPSERDFPSSRADYSPSFALPHDTLYVAFPFQYRIHAVAPDGSATTIVDASVAAFQPPATPLMIDGQNQEEVLGIWQDWRVSWTPIVAVAVHGDQLFVQYQVFDPLRYAIDVWSVATGDRLHSLRTNHRLLDMAASGETLFQLGPDDDCCNPFRLFVGEALSLEETLGSL